MKISAPTLLGFRSRLPGTNPGFLLWRGWGIQGTELGHERVVVLGRARARDDRELAARVRAVREDLEKHVSTGFVTGST